jgi:hypothetical protein
MGLGVGWAFLVSAQKRIVAAQFSGWLFLLPRELMMAAQAGRGEQK